MKTLQTSLLFALLFAIPILLGQSCKKSADSSDESLEANLLKSQSKYATLISERHNGSNFDIENVKRDGHLLTISLKGGCKAEDFKAVWDGSIMFSNPGQINLVLYSNVAANCDPGNQLNITINLKSILGTLDPNEFIINVANGSKKEDLTLNPNNTVTFK